MNIRRVKKLLIVSVLMEECCSSFVSAHVTVEDLERNDGSAERPYYMSQNLLTLLKKSNEEPKSVD